jgi:hypothetical protein
LDKIDTFGKWFLVFKNRNECCDGIFGVYDRNGQLETRLYPHARYDGYSVMNEYLAESGVNGVFRPPGNSPGISRQLKAFLAYLAGLPFRPKSRRLRLHTRGWPVSPFPVAKDRIAWRIFSEADTQKITSIAKLNQVPLNALLIAGLVPQLRPLWVDDTGSIVAGVTVSLHKMVGIDRVPRNRFSIIDITLDDSIAPVEINRRIHKALRRDRHLASWISYHLPDYLGDWFYQYFLLTIAWFQNRNIVFTNVGEWSAGNNKVLFLIPPVFHYNPVSVGIIVWEGKLSIALQVHPHVDASTGRIESIMDNWSRALLSVDNIDYCESSATVSDLNIRRMPG